MYQTSLPITLCCFHRLLVAFRILWDTEIGTSLHYIPCRYLRTFLVPIAISFLQFYENISYFRAFCDATIDYSGIDRLGGVITHLNKTFRNDLLQILGSDHEVLSEPNESQPTTNTQEASVRVVDSPVISVFVRMMNMNSINVGGSTLLERIGYLPYNREDSSPMHFGSVDSAVSLFELLDGIILFYHAAAKKQVAKVASIREVMSEYTSAISDLKTRLDLVKNLKNDESVVVQSQLLKTIEIFNGKLSEQARHMAWVKAVVYSEEKQERLVWLLKIVLLTLQSASENGNLFSFVPEFYLEVLADLINNLKTHMHPTVSIENIPDFQDLLRDIAQFLCDHYKDDRIVNANSKDTLILMLAGFASNPITLNALESVSKESRLKMTTNLIRSYENRAWAQSNFILVRFWQGNGFAFRYDKSPHLNKKVGPKILNVEATSQPLRTFILLKKFLLTAAFANY